MSINSCSKYQRVTRKSPCVVCGKDHWCRYAIDGRLTICNRVPSTRPALGEGGGWIHIHTGGRLTAFPLASAKPDPPKLAPAELAVMHRQFMADLSSARLGRLSDQLRVSEASLRALGIGWAASDNAYTFPMRSADGVLIGIRRRYFDGRKDCVYRSRLGLVFPNYGTEGDSTESPDVLLVSEGESDAAAALDLGFPAIARPGCDVCSAAVLRFVGIVRPPRTILLADADEPGQRGAHALAKKLAAAGHECRVLTLPDGVKDLRAWKLLPESNHHVLAAIIEGPADRIVDCNHEK